MGSGRASAGRVLILTAPEGWPDESEWGLAGAAAHEYVHVWQLMLAGEDAFEQSAVWLVEGMAQWIALQALIDVQLLPAEYLACLLETPPGPLTPYLEILETPAGWRTALLNYLTSLQAVSQLVGRGELPMLERYLVNLGGGGLWEDAFSDAFGFSITDFYRQFAGADLQLGKRPRDLSFALQRWHVLSASQLGSRLEPFRLKVQTQLLEPNGWMRCS
ncbi:MAG: hypothetical protein GEU75_14905 [Dehalococcoidia bacterium]|nr:hypothetical protein [Dehalococcoidia bacterium]